MLQRWAFQSIQLCMVSSDQSHSSSNFQGLLCHFRYSKLAWLKKANIIAFNSALVRVFTFLRIAPAGIRDVHDMLVKVATSLIRGGETGEFQYNLKLRSFHCCNLTLSVPKERQVASFECLDDVSAGSFASQSQSMTPQLASSCRSFHANAPAGLPET